MTSVSINTKIKFNRLAIIGNPASGKSTLAEALGKICNLPVFHLDLFIWKPNWSLTKEEEFALVHAALLMKKQWIIEGYSYPNQMIERLAQAEKIIFLDTPLKVCLERARQRSKQDKIIPNRFLPENCPFEKIQAQHLEFIQNFHKNIRPNLLKLLNKNFVSKPQIKLDGRLSVEDLCFQFLNTQEVKE